MEPAASVDSFGTFLKTVQQPAPVMSQSDQADTEGQGARINPLKLLLLINRYEFMPIRDLLLVSEMGFDEFVEAYRIMRDSKLISLVGTPGQEEAHLTDQGKQLAQLVPK
jgi:hypothetical protein